MLNWKNTLNENVFTNGKNISREDCRKKCKFGSHFSKYYVQILFVRDVKWNEMRKNVLLYYVRLQLSGMDGF